MTLDKTKYKTTNSTYIYEADTDCICNFLLKQENVKKLEGIK